MRKLILLTVLALGPTVTWAENRLIYLGAGVARNSVTDITDQAGFSLPDLKNTSWKAYAGVRPLDWLGAELDYIDLGSASSAPTEYSAHISASTYAAYAVGFLPIPTPALDIFGKVGFASWKYDEQISFAFVPGSPSGSNTQKGTTFAWGIGAQAHISVAGVRLEYESFKVNGNTVVSASELQEHQSTAKIASLSVYLTF
jgi:opacity protein-like surface antigen